MGSQRLPRNVQAAQGLVGPELEHVGWAVRSMRVMQERQMFGETAVGVGGGGMVGVAVVW